MGMTKKQLSLKYDVLERSIHELLEGALDV